MTQLPQVTSLFCVAVGLNVCRTLPPLVRFYSWFKDCGLEISNYRGYGQSASKFYGMFGAPQLSVFAMGMSGALFAASLFAVAFMPLPDVACAAMLCASLLFYHLYFSQLYC